MRAVLQRVTRASVRVGGGTVGEIGAGLLVLLGVARGDTGEDARYLLEKITGLRVFADGGGRMNLSVAEARRTGLMVETGGFGSMMEVELVNDGPVTILIDSGKLF